MLRVLGEDPLRFFEVCACAQPAIEHPLHDERQRPHHRGDEPHRADIPRIVTGEHQNTRSKPPSNAVPCVPMIGAASATNCMSAARNITTSTTTANSDFFSLTRAATARANSTEAVASATNTEQSASGRPALLLVR